MNKEELIKFFNWLMVKQFNGQCPDEADYMVDMYLNEKGDK
jgi:hypothetical protein